MAENDEARSGYTVKLYRKDGEVEEHRITAHCVTCAIRQIDALNTVEGKKYARIVILSDEGVNPPQMGEVRQ